MAPRVVTAGETMLLGVPSHLGLLRHAGTLEVKVGGVKVNVAVALMLTRLLGYMREGMQETDDVADGQAAVAESPSRARPYRWPVGSGRSRRQKPRPES